MLIHVFPNKVAMGRQAANDGATLIQAAIAQRGEANIVLATGASQFEMIDELVKSRLVDWQHVNVFHLDEYVGLPISHPGSFRLYLWRRFASRLPVPLKAFHSIDGECDPHRECARLSDVILSHEIDVAFVGIGENGHLAFNDPPADFEIETPYIVAQLDEACRRQQLGEGWFESLESVPRRAISMSVRHIMKSRHIICTVPDRRKSEAVQRAFEGAVDPSTPASILQTHPAVTVYLDCEAASLCKVRAG